MEERERKRSPVVRSHVLPAAVDGPDLRSPKERELSMGPIPFLLYFTWC